MKKTKLKFIFVAMALIMLSYIVQTNSFLTEGIENPSNKIQENKESAKQVIIGYYPAWKSYTGYTPEKIDISKLTHINYAFANIDDDYKIAMGYPDIDPINFKKFQELKKVNPDLKVLISVGGWNWSGRFSDMASTEESRTKFADSCAEFISKYGLDGVDLDWEYPVGGGMEGNSNSPQDKENFTLLLKNLREKLDGKGLKDNKEYLLTIAAGASNYYIKNTEVKEFHNYLNYVNIMTYDIHGPWEMYSDFNSPLYNNDTPQYKISIDSAVNSWIEAGLPADKLIVGIPFYGYKYSVPSNDNKGLYQKHTDGKAVSYKEIEKSYLNNPKFIKNFHNESLVPWLYDGNTFVSYDDAESISLKASYIKEKKLGGAMIWELSQDHEGKLLNSLYKGFHNNLLISKDYQGHWAEEAIQKSLDKGFIKGYPDGTFRPEGYITRAEFVSMVNKLYKSEDTAEISFTDVDRDSWYYEEIQKSYKNGDIVGVSDTEFAPEDNITREQVALIIFRLLDLKSYEKGAKIFYDNDQISNYAKECVGAVTNEGLMKGYEDNSFRPLNYIKRAEAVALLNRIWSE